MSEEKLKYPKAKRCACTIDKYHDKRVPDAYRWLESPESEEVKNFVQEQNTLTEEWLQKCPFREAMKKRLTEFVNYPNMYCPKKEGDKYFYYKSNGSQNQKVLYMQESLKGPAITVLDPNTVSEDGTVAIIGHAVSKNGEVIAIRISEKGSDWISVHFKNLKTMEDLPDVLEHLNSSRVVWTHDNLGVFYARFPEPKQKDTSTGTSPIENEKMYYHKIDGGDADDILISEFPDNPKWSNYPIVTDCGKYLLNQVYQGTQHNLIFYAELHEGIQNSKLDFLPIIGVFEADYDYVTNDDTMFYFVTNKNAPNHRIIVIDINKPNEASWKTLIPEDREEKVLTMAKPVNKNKLLTLYIQDVRHIIQLRNLSDGSIIKIFQTDMGNVTAFSASRNNSEFFYEISSFISPETIYHVKLENNTMPEPKSFFSEVKIKGYDPTKLITSQVFFSSKDGTKIPMYIVKKKATAQKGESPCILYGYGGYGIPILPTFNPYTAFFIQTFDAVVAYAGIRGGGEYGSSWHDAGSNFCKQNCFDDFQAAAIFLTENNFTNKDKLAIRGGSNGGLLIGACINQRPDLFRAAIAQNGVFDMLRFHKFTVGHNWCVEYGCSDKTEQFEYLTTYSPLHNVKMPPDCQYPSVLITTDENDGRVPPLHSYKFAAELQSTVGHHARQTHPLLIRIDTKSGHGFGTPLAKLVQEWIDIFSFLALELNLSLM